ncbi:unnamed protein product [Urochloa humidicola]
MSSSGLSSWLGHHHHMPLVPCTKCKGAIKRFVSKQGVPFYKCEHHVKGDPMTCNQYWYTNGVYLNHLRESFPEVYANFVNSAGLGSVVGNVPKLVPQSGGAIPSQCTQGNNDVNQQLSDLKCAHCQLKIDFYDFKLNNEQLKAAFNDLLAQYTELKNEFINLKNELEELQTRMRNKKGKPLSWGATIAAVVVLVISVMVAVFMFAESK